MTHNSSTYTHHYCITALALSSALTCMYVLAHTELVEDRGFLETLHDLISDANPTVVSQSSRKTDREHVMFIFHFIFFIQYV